MNYINFNQTGGFPLSTNILDALQTSYNLFNQLGNLAGDFAIISGCEVNGSSVTDGTVFLNGELLPFQAGNLSDTVIITVEPVKATFQDAEQRDVIYKRQVRFGTAGPEDTYAWSRFKRIFKTTEIEAFKADHTTKINNHTASLSNHEARIASLEAKVAAVEVKPIIPIGTIIRYDLPMTIPPPTGWIDWNPNEEQGRVWAAKADNDSDFALGTKKGSKTHTLLLNEMPQHSHGFNPQTSVRIGGANLGNNGSDIALVEPRNSEVRGLAGIGTAGGNAAHNNLQPYVAVRYIKYSPTN